MTETLTLPRTDEVAGTWSIDQSHSNAAFAVKYMMVSTVRGRFDNVTGTVTLADRIEDSTIDVTLDVASISTHDERRDGHLKSPDFFDVENHPEMTFTSTKIERTSDDTGKVTGDLTIRGVARPVVLDVRFEDWTSNDLWGKARIGFTARTSISRKDWDLNWNQVLETGGVLVGDRVDIDLDVQLTKG
ncbi:MAG TPA: YceI family protein [Actinomycetota bacterium]|nr:YceI family protein [Actinomycetota bacterium]